MRPIRNILVPVDFSDGARAAVEHATSLGRSLNAAVHIVHIFSVPLLHADTVVNVSGHPTMTLVDHMKADLTRLLDVFIDDQDVSGVVLTRSLEIGPPMDTIIKLTEDYELCVMGTHGRRGFKRFVLGSVSELVVRAAACPVLVVHAQEGKEDQAAE